MFIYAQWFGLTVTSELPAVFLLLDEILLIATNDKLVFVKQNW